MSEPLMRALDDEIVNRMTRDELEDTLFGLIPTEQLVHATDEELREKVHHLQHDE
ncbi:MAG: hypothetical protein WEA04_04895 [Candidatus Andersenbacteria bacterium]